MCAVKATKWQLTWIDFRRVQHVVRLQYVVAARVVLVDDGVGAVNERRLITAKLKGAHQIGVRYEAYVARWQVTAAVAAAAAADDAVDAVADVAADALCRVHQ